MMVRNRPLIITVTAVAALAAATPFVAASAAAEDPWQPSEEQRARIEARFEEIRERLDLSEAQRAELEPVLRQDFEKRAEAMRRHGVTRENEERPSRSEMRALRRDLKAVRDATDAEVERILDPKQFQEYRKIQEEARDGMRERMRSRRQESTE